MYKKWCSPCYTGYTPNVLRGSGAMLLLNVTHLQRTAKSARASLERCWKRRTLTSHVAMGFSFFDYYRAEAELQKLIKIVVERRREWVSEGVFLWDYCTCLSWNNMTIRADEKTLSNAAYNTSGRVGHARARSIGTKIDFILNAYIWILLSIT